MDRKMPDVTLPKVGLRRQLSGWHPEDVKAAIRKKGESLASLARKIGFSEAYLRNALIRPLYRGEQIIARFIGVPAHRIWPDRYDSDGTTSRQPSRRKLLRRAA